MHCFIWAERAVPPADLAVDGTTLLVRRLAVPPARRGIGGEPILSSHRCGAGGVSVN